MKILTVGDLHVRDGNPLGRTDNYKEAIFQKLMSIQGLALEHQVEHTVFLGDIFDQKRGSRVSDTIRQRLIVHFNSWHGEVWVVPGNHDMGSKGLSSLSNQPLGTVIEGSEACLLVGESILAEEVNAIFCPRPYNEARDADPTYYSLTEEERRTASDYPEFTTIMFAHGSLLGPGDDRPYPYVDAGTIPDPAAIIISGHIHENLGIHTLPSGQLFYNSGSIGRTARTQANMTRTIQVGIIDMEEKTTMLYDVPGVAPASEVFEVAGPTNEAEVNDEVIAFVQRLGEGLRAEQLTIDELLAGGDMNPDVKKLVKRLLEEAS